MLPIETLANEARALAGALVPLPGGANAHAEVARQMKICNACRYCEGFCAVFQAMTRRLEFPPADVRYLANLCHNCGACLHACQYAPPHAFQVNVPQAMAVARLQSYTDFAWPTALSRLYERNGLTLALALVVALAAMLALAVSGLGGQLAGASGFYRVIAHPVMVLLFLPVCAYALLALAMGVRRYWKEVAAGMGAHNGVTEGLAWVDLRTALKDILQLRYLDGGHGQGCNNADDRWTLWRQRMHHAVFYGFLLCLAATTVASVYHCSGHPAPYPWPSVPKIMGVAGGAGLLIGSAGLWLLNLARHPLHGDARQRTMDRGFIALLFFCALSGFALWAAQADLWVGIWLVLHLGAVMGLFITLPYGKFVHGIYRGAALLIWAVERRTPSPFKLPAD